MNKVNGNQNDVYERDEKSEKFSFQNIKNNCVNLTHSLRQSRTLVLLVVFIALFFDNMLLTTVGKLLFILNKKFCISLIINLII
jgi:hypothetical protein